MFLRIYLFLRLYAPSELSDYGVGVDFLHLKNFCLYIDHQVFRT